MRPRHVVQLSVAALVVLVVASGYDAFTASSTVAASKVGYQSQTITPNELKPAACTMTVTSIDAGSGRFNATATFQLVLGSSSADTVTLLADDCFVGGGPTSGRNFDDAIGVKQGGDQCILNTNASSKNCTIVETAP